MKIHTLWKMIRCKARRIIYAMLGQNHRHLNDLIIRDSKTDREQSTVPYQKLINGDWAVSVHDENLGTQVISFAELGRYEHAGTGNQLQIELSDRQHRHDLVEINQGQQKYFFLAILLLRYLHRPAAAAVAVDGSESECSRSKSNTEFVWTSICTLV